MGVRTWHEAGGHGALALAHFHRQRALLVEHAGVEDAHQHVIVARWQLPPGGQSCSTAFTQEERERVKTETRNVHTDTFLVSYHSHYRTTCCIFNAAVSHRFVSYSVIEGVDIYAKHARKMFAQRDLLHLHLLPTSLIAILYKSKHRCFFVATRCRQVAHSQPLRLNDIGN